MKEPQAMRLSNSERPPKPDDGVAIAVEAARSLGRALGESSAFKAFETAYELFQADRTARQKLSDFQSRQQEVRLTAMWGGSDPDAEQQLEREWQTISSIPSLGGYLRAQNELLTLFREVTAKISQEVGIDYGAACSPSGGCC